MNLQEKHRQLAKLGLDPLNPLERDFMQTAQILENVQASYKFEAEIRKTKDDLEILKTSAAQSRVL